jgi:hypothetical protein
MRIINIHKLLGLVSIVILTCSASAAFAKNINLYDQPNTTAKVVGSINESAKLVPIFTNKAGDWMKVGDPTNGNVGWVKVSDFNNSGNGATSAGFSISEETVNTPNGPKTYRTIQFAQPEDNAQTQLAIKHLVEQQQAIMQNSQRMFNDVYKQMNDLYKSNPAAFGSFPPIMMPVVVVPQIQSNGAATTTVNNPVQPQQPAPVTSTSKAPVPKQ